jgi:hippurate hydrolase
LHHPSYDFNDDALAFGVRWFVAVAQLALQGTDASSQK